MLSVRANLNSSTNIDSLIKCYQKGNDYDQKVYLLKQIIRFYSQLDISTSNQYCYKLLDISKEKEDLNNQYYAERSLGKNFQNSGDYRKSIDHLDRCLILAQKIKNDDLLGHAYNCIANTYSLLLNNKKAIHFYNTSLNYFAKSKDKSGSFYVLHNLAELYIDIERYLEAETLLNNSLQRALKSQNPYVIPETYLLLGKINVKKQKYDVAIKFLYEAKATASEFKRMLIKSEVDLEIGDAYFQTSQWDSAFYYIEKALIHFSQQGIYGGLARANFKKGQILWSINDYKMAKLFFRKAIDISSKNERIDIEMKANQYLSQCLEQEQIFKWSKYHFDQYIQLKDSLSKRKNNLLILDMALSYDVDKKERRIKILKAETELNKMQYQLTFLLALLLIILSFWLFRGIILSRRRKDLELSQLNEQRKLAELELLQAQINPQFIYASLKNMSQIVISSPSIAEELIVSLSDYCRYTINARNKNTAPIKEAILMLKNYIQLESLSFKKGITVKYSSDKKAFDKQIPRTIIQSLFKMIIEQRRHEHGVELSFGVDFTVSDSDKEEVVLKIGYDGAKLEEKQCHGFGLTNIYDNLNMYFIGSYTIDFNNEVDQIIILKLTYS